MRPSFLDSSQLTARCILRRLEGKPNSLPTFIVKIRVLHLLEQTALGYEGDVHAG